MSENFNCFQTLPFRFNCFCLHFDVLRIFCKFLVGKLVFYFKKFLVILSCDNCKWVKSFEDEIGSMEMKHVKFS
jgi:hypothetical protein